MAVGAVKKICVLFFWTEFFSSKCFKLHNPVCSLVNKCKLSPWSVYTKGLSPNYSFQKWNEMERFFRFVWLQNPFHNLKWFIHYIKVSPWKWISVTKIRFTLKLQKKHITKWFCKKSVPFYKRYRFISDPFDIRYSWICELGKIGTVYTVFKYVSLQKRYPKLLIKLGTDFEVEQKRKTVPCFVSLLEWIIWRWSPT
jgi:hypothetical protein